MLSVTRALRALARFREPAPRLTPTLPVVDPPVDAIPPIGEPALERTVQIPLYLEP
ncbi:MAG: hypothetical protein ACT4P6_12920 [Gemmatimonadaceae bacterium]